MKKKISSIVGPGNVSDNELDIEAYSYCSSEKIETPKLIVWPETPVQVRRLMHYFNQSHTPIIIRGSGTSKVDTTIRADAVILCSERMNKVLSINTEKMTVEVQSGARLSELNLALSELDLSFPIIPFNDTKTIGGMVAVNIKSKESHQLNPVEARVWKTDI